MKFLATVFFLLFTTNPVFAASDPLAQETIQMDSRRSSEVLSRTLADPKAVFGHFQPALDSGSKIVKPLVVGGTADHPIVQVSIQKCVAFVCQVVDLDLDVTVREISGACDRNFMLQGNMTRSSATLADNYDRLDVAVCYRSAADGTGAILLNASVNQGPKYNPGMIQKEILKLMRLQVAPIVKAVQLTMKEKENSEN